MSSKSPIEYLTLPSGPTENYAEVYGQRLSQPYACPNGGERMSSCDGCVNELYQKSGESRFSKVRLNITSLTITGKFKG